jgi:hypothetical protein
MTAALDKHLSHQIFWLVIWVETQPIEEGKSISRDREGYCGPTFNIAAGFAAYNWIRKRLTRDLSLFVR